MVKYGNCTERQWKVVQALCGTQWKDSDDLISELRIPKGLLYHDLRVLSKIMPIEYMDHPEDQRAKMWRLPISHLMWSILREK